MAQLGKPVKGRTRDKKKKAGKSGDEEKVLQDKLRRMQEADYRKRLTMQVRTELKARLAAEQKNSRVNSMRIQNQWRKIMRLAKVEALRKEIEVLSQNHERDVDRKDAIIQMLDRDLQEAEEQYQMALRSHLRNLDQLIQLQDERLLALENEFERDLATLEDEFQSEKQQIKRQHTRDRTELMDLIGLVDAKEAEASRAASTTHEQVKEEHKRRSLEERELLRMQLNATIEDLERHFETAHVNYLQNTNQRTQKFKYYTRADQEASREIRGNIRRIERLQDSRRHWLAKLQQNRRECEARNEALMREKNAILHHFQALKTRMARFRTQQCQRLVQLSERAKRAKDSLQERIALAERILSLAERARAMETEREKVVPFYESSLPVEAADASELAKGTAGVDGTGEHAAEWDQLEKFHRRLNKVLLENVAIDKERQRLQREHQELQSILKQYLDGVSVSAEVLSHPNPLFVVNGRANLSVPPVRPAVRPTVVEAAHVSRSQPALR